MGLFNFFKSQNKQTSESTSTVQPKVEIPKEVFIDESDPIKNGQVNGQVYGIDSLYAFIQADYESAGYNDAIANPDPSYKSQRLNLLAQDLKVLSDRVLHYYSNLASDIDNHIISRSREGLTNLIEELKAKRKIVDEQIEKVKAIQNEAQTNKGLNQRMALSYECGFSRGLTTLTQANVLNRPV